MMDFDALEASEEASQSQAPDVQLHHEPLFVVVQKFNVVRTAPSLRATALGTKFQGDCVAAVARRGHWLRVLLGEKDAETWMLEVGDPIGSPGERLLELAPDDAVAWLRIGLRLSGSRDLLTLVRSSSTQLSLVGMAGGVDIGAGPPSGGRPITLYVHGALSGEQLAELSVSTTDTLADLRLAICDATGHQRLRLLINCQPVRDDEQLVGDTLQDGSRVDVVALRRLCLLATASDDSSARLWDAGTGTCEQVLTGHKRNLKSVALSPDGDFVATSSSDCTAKIWRVSAGRCLTTLSGHMHYVNSADFSPDGHLVATGAAEACTHPNQLRHQKGAAWVWDAEEHKCILKFEGHEGYVNSVAFSKDGHLLLTGANDQKARLWEITSGRCVMTFSGHTDFVNSAAFSTNCDSVVTASDDTTAKVWDTAMAKEHRLSLEGHHRAAVRCAAFSPSGSCIATASKDRTARLWCTTSSKCRHTLSGHRGSVEAVAFSPSGEEVVTGSLDRTAWIWDLGKAAVKKVLSGHTGGVASACFPSS